MEEEADPTSVALDEADATEERNITKKERKTVKYDTTCDVDFETPPNDVPFGSIEAQRLAKVKDPFEKPIRKESKVYPKNTKPKAVQFPFIAPTESAERILHTASKVRKGAGNRMGPVLVGHQKVIFPGWLVELNDATLETMFRIRKVFKSGAGKPFCEVLKAVTKEVDKLALGVTHSDVMQCLRRVTGGTGEYSFPRFMFAIADPHYGREKGIFSAPVPFDKDECGESDVESEKKVKSRSEMSKKSLADRMHQPNKYETQEDFWPFSKTETEKEMEEEELGRMHHDTKSTIGHVDETGYTVREKAFYSGLLIFEMYHLMDELEKLYYGDGVISEPQEVVLRKQHQRGFGGENAGIRKVGFAEWDRPLPPIPKRSPYLSNMPFVASRWKISKPNEFESLRRRTTTKLKRLYLNVLAPTEPGEPIKVTENQFRIKQAMEYLASTGNVAAKLPAVYCIIHLSDTLLEKLQVTVKHPYYGPPLPEPTPNDDLAAILQESKDLFKQHGIPKKITKMKTLVTYSCALNLRKVCEHMREQHWEYINDRKILFREKAWKYMHVDRIPCGALRENFVYAFNTYLPQKSYLPVVHDNTPLPL